MLNYLQENLSEEQLFKLTFDKGHSKDSVQVLKSALSNFEHFTKDQYNKTRLQVLTDLTTEYKKNRDTRTPLVLLNQFKDWLGKDHLDIFITVGNGGKRAIKAKRGRAQNGS